MKYDFCVLSVGRVATQAIWKYLGNHPELNVPSFYITDEILDSKLPEDIQEADMIPEKKNGLIIHSDRVIDEHDFVQFISPWMKSDKLIHMVRDPLPHLKSLYNHVLHRSYLNMIDHPGSPGEFLLKQKTLDKAKYFTWAKPFYDFFKETHIVDFTEMTTDNIDQTMKKLYAFLDVDPDFEMPDFKIEQQTDTRFYMHLKPCELQVGDVSVPIEMTYKGEATHEDFDTFLCNLPSLSKVAKFPMQNVPLQFYAYSPIWYRIHLKYRKLLMGSGEVKKAMISFMSQWLMEINSIEKKVKDQRITVIDDDLIQKMKIQLDQDVRQMINHENKLKKLWTFLDGNA